MAKVLSLLNYIFLFKCFASQIVRFEFNITDVTLSTDNQQPATGILCQAESQV